MAKILFEVADPRRCLIKLLEDRYQNHILLGHPEVEVRWIEQTIAYPSFIAQDVEMDAQTTYQTIDTIKPENIWANYDNVSDSLTVYITGKPVSSSVDWLDNLTGVLLDDNDTIVGFQIDHFERAWLPAHNEVAKSWPAVRRSMLNDGWSNLLRLIATAIFILMMHFNQDDNIALSPA